MLSAGWKRIIFALMVMLIFERLLTAGETHLVTNNLDNGIGSFRYCVAIANNEDSVKFAEPFVIALDSQIVIKEKSIWIDGLSQGKRVQLNGQAKTRALLVIGGEDKFIYIRNLEITNCYADYGAGMKSYCMYEFCQMIIDNVDFNRNRASVRGGAAVFAGGIVRNCMFFANHSALDGGAVYANQLEIINCVFLGNTCIERGSAGYFHHNIEVMNSTFIMNEPDLFYTIAPAYFYNSLFWNEFPLQRSSQESNFKTCLTNGWNEIGLQIIDESPFVYTPDAGTDTIWGTNDDMIDLRMKFGNVCINKGSYFEEVRRVDTDFNGNFRIIDDTIDIGAVEYDGRLVDSDDDGVVDSDDAFPLDYRRTQPEDQ